jgi:4-hydroxy-tetrahydrodipicolinate synthase
MARAHEAREWAKTHLRGLSDSMYTPFSGPDGDEIDYDAYRALIRYSLGDLDHAGLWLVSGLSEFWALTLSERKKLAEVSVEEARKVKPSAFLQVCTAALSAKETVELTLHAQEIGADIVYLQNPMMEVHGGPGILEFFKYVAERTDIALGMFNSPCSGYVMTPQEIARVAREIPAMCAIKDAAESPPVHGAIVARLAPELVVFDCSQTSLMAGNIQAGLHGPCVLGGIGYLMETPNDRRYSKWFNLILDGRLDEARKHFYSSKVNVVSAACGLLYSQKEERPGYWTHWASATKHCAQTLGLPVGDYPYSRPPQLRLSEEQKAQIEKGYADSGLLATRPALTQRGSAGANPMRKAVGAN